MPDLDAAMDLEPTVRTARAAVARPPTATRSANSTGGSVALEIEADEVPVGLVGAGDGAADAPQQRVGDDASLQADRAGEADRRSGHALDDRLVGQSLRHAAPTAFLSLASDSARSPRTSATTVSPASVT